MRTVRSEPEYGFQEAVPSDTDARREDVLGPELDVAHSRSLERLDDLLGEFVVVHDDEVDFFAHAVLPFTLFFPPAESRLGTGGYRCL